MCQSSNLPRGSKAVAFSIGTSLLVWAASAVASAAGPDSNRVEFNRDVRPILSDSCFQCHGPDSAQRQADLRLDQQESAFAGAGGEAPIVPGQPEQSELFRRITSTDPDERMPPADSGRALNDGQIETIRRWIEQGAEWQAHWSFIPPQRPALPAVRNPAWVRNGIDRFVLARLEREGRAPSPQADKSTLIRRVSLDLTGLPPTPTEVDAFLADDSPQAYERVVDRLLASSRYGERMAMDWLDVARYADTNGYQTDAERYMWRWRDWVIEAFNSNRPFDQFTIEQIAGDMLPNPTLEQIIATGFNRNHRGNGEGGIIAEEFAVEYVVDRVETTFTVWQGLTMGCARCHEHKFDPIEQKEFYQAFAYFNNVPESGKAFKYGNSAPFIKSPTRKQQAELAALDERLNAARKHFDSLATEIETTQSAWEETLNADQTVDWSFSHQLVARYTLDGDTVNATGQPSEATFDNGAAAFAEGRVGAAAEFDGARFLSAGDVGHFGFYDKFTLAAWVRPQGDTGTIISRVVQEDRDKGYSLVLDRGKLQLNLVVRWLDDSLRVETRAPLPQDEWSHVAVTYDGSRVAEGVRTYIDGEQQPLKINLDELNQEFKTDAPFRIGAGVRTGSGFHGALDDVAVFADCLTPAEIALIATPDAIVAIADTPPENRSRQQRQKLRICFLEDHAPESIRRSYEELVALQRERVSLIDGFPTTMVMQEMETPRETFVLNRGEYDKPGERVTPGLPASLPPLPADADNNRLGFAQWLVDESNPLTARVAVNRYWQMYFGTGLVKTAEDFGSQGEPPSHPELLDWLAIEFVSPSGTPMGSDTTTNWDVKALQKLIVMSATYRQTSKVTPGLLQLDPENRLLARGPRLRLPAETIRDQALAVSGLLVEKLGGPSVKPYQPAGLWKELSGAAYQQDHGDDLYRRSLYTFWKRTAGPPSMMAFDASARETCIVRKTRTNTPLQALTLLNDVTFVEAARLFAERMIAEGGGAIDARIRFGFRLATARLPGAAELDILTESLQSHLSEYRENPKAADELLSTGEFPRNETLDAREVAAYTAVAGLILNLDEVVTKE